MEETKQVSKTEPVQTQSKNAKRAAKRRYKKPTDVPTTSVVAAIADKADAVKLAEDVATIANKPSIHVHIYGYTNIKEAIVGQFNKIKTVVINFFKFLFKIK